MCWPWDCCSGSFTTAAFLWGQMCLYFGVCTDKHWIKSVLKDAGPLAPLVFIVIQALQVVYHPRGGHRLHWRLPVRGAPGPAVLHPRPDSGLGGGFFYRPLAEEHYVKRWIPAEILQKLNFLMERQGALVAFILFLLPGFPKDYLCFVLGLSRMPFKLFLLICIVGRIPGTLLLTLQGAKVYKGAIQHPDHPGTVPGSRPAPMVLPGAGVPLDQAV